MRCFLISVIVQLVLFSSSLCELSLDKQDSFLNEFVDYLNSRPGQEYVYEDGVFLKSTQIDANTYQIEISAKVFKLHYASTYCFQKCTATILDLGENGITIPNNEYQCTDWTSEETTPVPEGSTTEPVQVFEEPLVKEPIHLDNEVQPYNAPTSGEQFIAIPRDRGGPCIGCSSHVDPSAAGVDDLAALGARHLDKHEPDVKHTVIAVHDVERQVQVTNGIRYILTLTIGYNTCTDIITDNCVSDKICKISVLSKPWVKFPDGSKYKAILANNCTEQWLFGDNGETLPENLNGNKHTDLNDKIGSSGLADEEIKVVHTADVQAQQNEQVPFSSDDLKKIEEQVIPYSEFDKSLKNSDREGVMTGSAINEKRIGNVESAKKSDKDSIQVRNPEKFENTRYITEDKKKAIDDMLNLFNFAEFQPLRDDIKDVSRGKRSYTSDLQVMSVLEKFQKLKRKLKNAKYIYKLGKLLVDYLNEMDMEVKTRVLKDVIFAEEEIENDQHFFYIRVRVVIPCEKVECDSKDTHIKICNGIINSTDSKISEVVDTFCYDEEKNSTFGNVKNVPNNDPILLKLTNETVKKIEDEMHIGNALRVVKIINAYTQKVSGTLTKISMVLEFIDCNKTVPFYKRGNCLTVQALGTKICEAEIHERHWLKVKKITFSCTDRPLGETIDENMFARKSKSKGTHDPQVTDILNEALQLLEVQSNRNNKQKIVEIQSVSTQIVAGQLTNIDFVVGYTKCFVNDIYIDIKNCELIESERLRKCQAQVWERPWLQEGRQVKVVCDDTYKTENTEIEKRRKKRHITGGEKEVDAKDPKYTQLAQESLSKYLQGCGDTKPHTVLKVNKVSVQVVAGTLTKIYFDVQSSEEVFSCQSEVWERPWINSKEITVNCGKNLKSRQKKQIKGGAKEVDANDPKYTQLAQESLSKYLQDSGDTKPHTVLKVNKVTVQVVAGTLTKILFDVQSSEEVFSCQSEVWERPWLNSKEITVNCGKNQKSKQKRQITGGVADVDAKDPKYMQLAEESLSKFLQDSGNTKPHKVLKVNKVTVQVVAGTLTKMYFDVQGAEEIFSCQSDVWERRWLNSKEITVNCGKHQNSRKKRQLPGGKNEVDATNPKFVVFAQESLSNYSQISGLNLLSSRLQVNRVLEGIVAGTLYDIYFTVFPQGTTNIFSCYSEVWEQPWLDKREVTNVTCWQNDLSNRIKRDNSFVGGPNEKDSKDAKYMKLAEESLSKYLQDSGDKNPHTVVKVDKVTVQVVAGTLTTIDFKVQGSGEAFDCQSKVWERSWLESKEITVTCSKDQNSLQRRLKREAIIGGAVEEDPTNEKYIELAEESLNKYTENVGSTKIHKLLELNRVIKQLVSGTIIRLDFIISPTNCDVNDMSHKVCSVLENENIHCHSDIWERPWLKVDNKIIDVTCDDINKIDNNEDNLQGENASTEIKNIKSRHTNRSVESQNRTRKSGGTVEQDPTKPLYRVMADEALRKYQLQKKSSHHHEITHVKRVVSQVVSGMKYSIEFEVSRLSCALNCECDKKNNVTLTCYATIWSRPWLNSKEINVDCSSDEEGNEDSEDNSSSEEIKRRIRDISFGNTQNRDYDNKKYIHLALEAVKKYQKNVHTDHIFKINKILRVTEQVVSGFTTNMDFSISPTTCLLSEPPVDINDCPLQEPNLVLHCSAKITEPSIPRAMRIKIGCKKHIKRRNKKQKKVILNREKRESPYDDDYVEEDIKYYYADRAITDFNRRATTNNLYKVVSIHDVHRSVHMDTLMVRLYLEIAMTYCMRYGEEHDLQNCDEIDGMSHKLCLARVYPSPDDELVVQHATMTCNDEKNFEIISGISVDEFIRVSIAEIEKSPDIHYKFVPMGEPNIIPSLNYKMPITMNFVVHHTNCTIDIDLNKTPTKCVIDSQRSGRTCHSLIYLMPNSRNIQNVIVKCAIGKQIRAKRSVSIDPKNATVDDLSVQQMVQESIEKLEMASEHKYKQRVLVINSYSSKIVSGRLTTIDFDIGYTTCLKYEWVENATSCEFLEHLPRRHCISHVWERLWVDNGRQIEVNCEDDETPLEAHIEFESADNAMQLANEALKHIEAKYPNPRRQKIVRIFSLEQQAIAGLHYRMKVEVGLTDCMALSINKDDCKLVNDMNSQNKFCRVNVWMRPWTDHPPSFRVSCDYQSGAMDEIYHHVQAERLFYDFLTTYRPDYLNDATELKNRFAIFKENVRKIHELNIYERGTARYAVTRFADLSYEEFSSKYLGLKPGLRDHNQVPMRMAEIPDVELPTKYDWRDYGAVTEVKDQGSCGSCWAFSVTGNIEGQWKLQSGKLVSLSEQELVDCDDMDNGCNGGLPDNAYRAIEKLGGLETENDYPYEGADDKCAFNKSLSRVHISGAVNITSNETDMAKWLTRNGPISIGINANAMQFYVGGVSHPWKMLCNPKNLDHGVLIVGYGAKDYPLFHKHLPYWVIKNSWGERWGEQGYYRVYRGDGTCGVNQMASSAVI